MKKITSCHGSVLAAVLFSLVLLGMLSWTIAALVTTSSQKTAERTTHDQSFYNSMAGAEYALMQAKNNQTYGSSLALAGGSINFSAVGSTLTVTGSKFQTIDDASLLADGTLNAGCLKVEEGSVGTTAPGANTKVVGLGLINLCTTGFVLDKICLWTSDSSRRLREMSVGGSVVYSVSSPGTELSTDQTNPTIIDIANRTFAANETVTVDYIEFQQAMNSMDVKACMILSDGSRKTVKLINLQPTS